jgi:hypothetical protein
VKGLRHRDFNKTTKGIPRKGEETAEDVKYWKALLQRRDEHSKKSQNYLHWDRVYDYESSAIYEELYAIPAWWLKEND